MDLKAQLPANLELTLFQRRLLAAVQDGLPLVTAPYAALAAQLAASEAQVLAALRELRAQGVIKRFGVVVRHHELGYHANAMVVWDLPDAEVGAIGRRLGAEPLVRLSYRRPRRLPEWPYNLFTMVHGRNRDAVLAEVERLAAHHGLAQVPRAVLFSTRRFKQRGARYATPDAVWQPGCAERPEPRSPGEI
jgi:DNA-binding Lrp family transcriptional regulator